MIRLNNFKNIIIFGKSEKRLLKYGNVFVGGYDKEEKAARAYDLAALKYWGTTTTTNFPVS